MRPRTSLFNNNRYIEEKLKAFTLSIVLSLFVCELQATPNGKFIEMDGVVDKVDQCNKVDNFRVVLRKKGNFPNQFDSYPKTKIRRKNIELNCDSIKKGQKVKIKYMHEKPTEDSIESYSLDSLEIL